MDETIKPVGRPSSFTQELADKICERLAEGESLRTVCKADDMPSKATVFNWMRTNKGFLDQYARAKQESADAMAEEIQDIADDGTNDWMEVNGREVTGWKENGESIQRSKLRVDTRKWLMAKMKPKRYGDAINTDITSKGERIMVMPLELINKNDTSSGTIRNS